MSRVRDDPVVDSPADRRDATPVTEDVQTVLDAPPPRFSPNEASEIALSAFGIPGRATDLGSERDQNFLIDDGRDGAVLKISNRGEDRAVLDLQDAAILHIADVAPELPVAYPLRSASGDRPTVHGADGPHFVRMFERLEGTTTAQSQLDDGAVKAYGATHARLNVALSSFFHPAAGRELLWDLKHTTKLRALLDALREPRERDLVEQVLDRYDGHVAPIWGRLRAQVVHGDLTPGNVLSDERGVITGIVDFGDVAHTALIADVATNLASLVVGRGGNEVFRCARLALDGYQSQTPLNPEELAVLGDLIAARLAMVLTISAWRTRRYPENAERLQTWVAPSRALLEFVNDYGPERVARELGSPREPSTKKLFERRQRILGSAITPISYRNPVHLVRGEGVWLFDTAGNRLLDAYNNVPGVGHGHPRVTEAVARQLRALNTHARYLYEPNIELAERLVASMPAGSGLDTVMLVTSGSEANNVAWQVALANTGHTGGIVTSFAYHGVGGAMVDMSPLQWPAGHRPSSVELIAAPGSGSDMNAEMSRATAGLDERGTGLAATIIDGCVTSDGILTPSCDEMRQLVQGTHEAGGLYVADEVQAGHGRTGRHLWSFAAHEITPDIVTTGKPTGNGYPVAAVITRKDLVDRYATTTEFFSTFGGTPVAAQAALAVLNVIDDERLIDQAARVGARLHASLEGLRGHHSAIGEVRGDGMMIGVDLTDPDGGSGGAFTGRVINGMRDRGILVGSTGPDFSALKIRPPLVFAEQHAEIFANGLDEVLTDLTTGRG